MATSLEVMTAIRAKASQSYQDTIPIATKNNMNTIHDLLAGYTVQLNEAIDVLVNKICLVGYDIKIFNNPLANLRKGKIPYGSDAQDIMTNPAKSSEYALTSTDLLTVKLPDVKSAVYRINRKSKFAVTITKPEMLLAVTSDSEMNRIINMAIASLYSGDSIEEFELMKQLVDTAITNAHVTTETLSIPTDETTGKALIKAIINDSTLMQFPSADYNKYKTVTEDTTDAITFCESNEQILLLDAHYKSTLNVDVLAYAFNQEKLEMPKIVYVDNFNNAPCIAFLCDSAFFQVWESWKSMENMYNGDNLTFKYMLHHWQGYGYRTFANAKAYVYATA